MRLQLARQQELSGIVTNIIKSRKIIWGFFTNKIKVDFMNFEQDKLQKKTSLHIIFLHLMLLYHVI